MAKKMRAADDFLHHLYVHVNEMNQFVIFSGLTFQEFVSSVGPLQNLLLLKNEYDDSSFNMHTRLEFIEERSISRFSKRMADSKRDLCWIDFSDEKRLNLLTPQEQAELLYLGHKKEALRAPFYHQLRNRFVYLETKQEKCSKIYFRESEDIYNVVTNVFNNIIQIKERPATFWRRKATAEIPRFDAKFCEQFREELKDGALFSMYRIEKPKVAYVLEVRNLSEIDYPDEIWDGLDELLKLTPENVLEVHK